MKYEVEAFYMKNLNGDEKLELLRDKIERKEHLTGEAHLLLKIGKNSEEEVLGKVNLVGKVRVI